MSVRVKRVYYERAKSDGYRVLVDRLWPRGLTKKEAQIDEWLKEVAPSTPLRKSFGHDPGKWTEFKKKYWDELDGRRIQLEKLARDANRRSITLLYSAKNTQHNNAVALKEYLDRLA
jgi:uncharacterized protein YeaO (DUF488 family)